jgi:microcystin-dependent protein
MSTPYVGEIRLFSFQRIPTGWFACDGSLKAISNYDALFALIGTTYGGDGVNTFAVPDLRGATPIHQGSGSGLSTRIIGQTGGTETVNLLTAQIPQHSHAPVATSNSASTNTPGTSVVPGALTSGDTMYATDLTGNSQFTLSPTNAISMQGGNLPHDNRGRVLLHRMVWRLSVAQLIQANCSAPNGATAQSGEHYDHTFCR